ncbi:MAG: LPS-assembly protein LptD [Acidobacteriaceae bacterium]|nr:LPS-assembly protein LptD [Acidobacteriaceae bacterium]
MFIVPLCLLTGAETVWAQSAVRPQKADIPAADEIRLEGLHQESNGSMRYLHKPSRIETSDFILSADEIQYNSDTAWAYAQGHVHLEHFNTGDKINADHAEYNIKTQSGKFYLVDGTAPAKIVASPSVLTTTNPFYFQAQWAERIKERYILHHGFLTDCTIKKPWWTFYAPVFDVIPGERAIARNTVFRLKRVPIFYLPYFYRPLGKNPRQSGFLTPNVGHSSLYGYVVGAGYYWAINRSYDMTAIGQFFSERGPALRYDFRGKPNEVTDFDFNYYGVNDQGVLQQDGTRQKQGGQEFELVAKTNVLGFTGRLDYNYLSSFLFRQAFSYSFTSAISNEIYSTGLLQRHFKDDLYVLNIVFQRQQLIESLTQLNQVPNQVVIQKLPSVEFNSRDKLVANGPLPVWFSFGSSATLFTRSEPTGQINQSGPPSQVFNFGELGRFNAEPRIMTEFNFKGFSLNPSVTFGATGYTNSYSNSNTSYSFPISPDLFFSPQRPTSCNGYPTCPPISTNTVALANVGLFRKNIDFVLDFRPPSIQRVFTPPAWLHLGGKIKHVAEAQATYEYVTGINQFQKTIHFDATDILSNTNQLTLSLTNRLYRKDKKGNVSEFLTWRLAHARYFDPTFGGAIFSGQPVAGGYPPAALAWALGFVGGGATLPSGQPTIGYRNVVLATAEFSPFAFLDGPRNYSPVTSSLTISPYNFFSMEWRTEYDPVRRRFIDHTISGNVRYGKYFAFVGTTAITAAPVLVPQANQISFGGGYGNANRKGWNAAGTFFYDVLRQQRLFNLIQGSYNTDCCGWSIQLRQINLGIRNENQYLFSFSVANIGNFGSLQKQARIF